MNELKTIESEDQRQILIKQLLNEISKPVPEEARAGDIEQLLNYANNGNSAKLTIELKSANVHSFKENIVKAAVIIMAVGVAVPFVMFSAYILKNGVM